MTFKLNVHETLQELRDANLSAAARIAIDDLLHEVEPDEEFSLDLYPLLQRNRLIAHTWCIDDVRKIRPDLDDDQAWEVLQRTDKYLDSEIGISWQTLEIWADDLVPQPDDAGEPDAAGRQP
jgi:hypothetical protein